MVFASEKTFDGRFCADSWDSKEFLITGPEIITWLINVEQR